MDKAPINTIKAKVMLNWIKFEHNDIIYIFSKIAKTNNYKFNKKEKK